MKTAILILALCVLALLTMGQGPVAGNPQTINGSLTVTGTIATSGTGAGYLQLGAGSAQSVGTTAVTEEAPSSVTSYVVTLASAGPANNNMAKNYTALSSSATTESYVQAEQKKMLTSAYTNTTTGATTVISLSVDASTSYVIHCRGLWMAAASGEWSFGITGPASPTLVSYHFQKCNTISSAACTYLDYVGTGSSYPSAIGATVVGTAATDMPWEVDMGFTNGSTAGTLALTGLTVSTDTLTVEAGSYCQMQ